jgi:hypothetical protein
MTLKFLILSGGKTFMSNLGAAFVFCLDGGAEGIGVVDKGRCIEEDW